MADDFNLSEFAQKLTGQDPPAEPDPEDAPAESEEPAEPVAEAEVVDDAAAADAATQELLAGKYKTTDDLVAGYKELERRFHAERQPAAEQEPDPEPTFTPLSPRGEPSTLEDLYEWAQTDPAGAGQWAYDHQQVVPQQNLGELMNHWYASSPWQAQQYIDGKRTEQFEQQRLAQMAPLEQKWMQDQAAAAHARANVELADYAKYEPQIKQLLAENPEAAKRIEILIQNDGPDGMFNALSLAYAQVVSAEFQRSAAAARQQAAQPPQDDEARRRASTTAGTKASEGSADDDVDAIRKAISGAR